MRKQCTKCKEVKPIEDFQDHPETADKKLNQCRACVSEYKRRHYQERKQNEYVWKKMQRSARERYQKKLFSNIG